MKEHVKQKIGELYTEEKVVAIASLAVVAGCFLPWSSWPNPTQGTDQPETIAINALQGQIWLMGWMLIIFAVIALFAAVACWWGWDEKKILGLNRMALPFFLGLESFFVVVMAMSVLSYSDYIGQEVEFGAFFVLLATALITLGGFIGLKRRGKRSVRTDDSFVRMPEEVARHGGSSLRPEEGEWEEGLEDEDVQQSLLDDETEEDHEQENSRY